MPQFNHVIQSLHEDAHLREDLVDSEARILLQWGERQVAELGKRDEAQFEEAFKHLRQLMTDINRFIGRRAYLPPDEQRALLDKIAESAAMMNYKLTPEQIAAYFQQQAALDNEAALTALTVLVDTAPRDSNLGDKSANG